MISIKQPEKIALSFMLAALAALGACSSQDMKKPAQEPNASNVIHPEIWPEAAPLFPPNPALEAKIDAILSKMTLEQKVGQIIQADSSSITPEDLKTYKLGSILSGGNSGPNGKPYGSAADWLAMLDAFYDAEMQGPDGEVMIPPLFGIDAVHGHNNVIGATIFPHNIGLGATRDPKLIRRIAEATAIELSVTGHDWTFAPTLTVPRDDRWGRTYEGFSENPDVVRSYAAAIVDGLQGDPGTPGFLGAGKVVASAKHFLADGGTDGGRDQGDASIDEEGLRDIHGAGYPPAVEAGVQTVMASFSSWRGVKMHGDKPLLTGVLKGRMHFDGFIVGDWNAHGQLPGCTTTDCPSALLAGLDMYMAPDSWRELYDSTLKEVRGGAIPMARLDDAVRRILRVKFRAGLFDKGRPSSRPYAGRTEYLGSPEHRAIARQAVRESLVLLKNNHGVLPLDPSKHILVVGESANSIASQCGGWTLTWQGTGLSNDLFPHGETILEGFQKAAAAAGGAVVYSADGKYEGKPDAAIFVFGEQPYAEFQGDIPNVNFGGRNAAMLDRMRALKKAGVPVISVFISGRPLWVNPEMNASDAFVAAWLPGTEGGGVADVLLRKPDGRVNYDFTGKLSYSWPASPTQTPLNVGDPDYAPLFPFGFGLTYQASAELGVLPEEAAATAPSNTTLYFAKGGAPAPFHLYVGDGTAESPADGPEGASPKGGIAYKAASRQAQDDSKSFVWRAGKTAYLKIAGTAPLDLSRQTNGDMTLSIEARVDNAPSGPVMLSVECGEKCRAGVDIADRLSQAGAWRRVDVSLRCFAAKGASMNAVTAPFRIDATGPLAITVSQIELRQDPGDALECGR